MPGIKRRKFEQTEGQAERIKVEAKPRCALYLRVSTEEQAQEGYSLGSQEERLTANCTARDWIPVKVYRDEGFTGRDTKRPGYQELMQQMDSWDVVAVVKLDRIHRSSRNFMGMTDHLMKREKGFFSLAETFDTTTTMGRFAMDMMARIAQLESETTSDRAKGGMLQAVKTGNVAMGTRSAFGYRWKHQDGSYGTHSRNPKDGSPSELVQDPETAPLVRKIFKWAAKGLSAQKISKELEWCHCKPRTIKRKYAIKLPNGGTDIKTWESKGLTGDCQGCTKIRYVLQNPTYLGYVVFAGQIHKGTHEPMIERALFDAYNKRRRVKVILPDSPRKKA